MAEDMSKMALTTPTTRILTPTQDEFHSPQNTRKMVSVEKPLHSRDIRGICVLPSGQWSPFRGKQDALKGGGGGCVCVWGVALGKICDKQKYSWVKGISGYGF